MLDLASTLFKLSISHFLHVQEPTVLTVHCFIKASKETSASKLRFAADRIIKRSQSREKKLCQEFQSNHEVGVCQEDRSGKINKSPFKWEKEKF